MSVITDAPALVVQGVSKSFRILSIPKGATLKETLVRGRFFARERQRSRILDALNDVSFEMAPGEVLGIIGRNGSGKSTLMKILAGVMAPDRGSVRIRGEVAPLLSLGVGFHPDLTGRENARLTALICGVPRNQLDYHLERVVEFAELSEFFDIPMRTYSTGMSMRLAFSCAVNVDPDVMLLDEIFAVGDAAFSQKCREKMMSFRESGKTIVIVSHDVHGMASFCDRIMWLDGGRIREIGDPTAVADAYQREFGA